MRYKEFNRNNVLEKCIPLFWKNGFNACAISEIVDATRVNRYSLYEEFENKEGILHASMELYIERYASKKMEVLKSELSIKESLVQLCTSFFGDEQYNQDGCYIIHVGSELASTDEKVQQILKQYLADLEVMFVDLLKTNDTYAANATFYAPHLIGMFCTSMSFSLIMNAEERLNHITNSINIILDKQLDHATNA